MPLQNRVAATGDILAVPVRGTMMGNRGGRMHTPDRRLTHRRWVSRQWICCLLAFNGRQRAVMGPNTYTELFFLDEATALAAGHRPCFECRRQDAQRFAEAFGQSQGMASVPKAAAMDAILHTDRLLPSGAQRLYVASLDDLPDGTMVLVDATPHLAWGGALHAWSFAGYGAAISHPSKCEAAVLTPRATVATLRSGYRPDVHSSARIPR